MKILIVGATPAKCKLDTHEIIRKFKKIYFLDCACGSDDKKNKYFIHMNFNQRVQFKKLAHLEGKLDVIIFDLSVWNFVQNPKLVISLFHTLLKKNGKLIHPVITKASIMQRVECNEHDYKDSELETKIDEYVFKADLETNFVMFDTLPQGYYNALKTEKITSVLETAVSTLSLLCSMTIATQAGYKKCYYELDAYYPYVNWCKFDYAVFEK